LQRYIDHAVGQWHRQFKCIVQQQDGHIEHLMQDFIVTLDND